MWTKEQFFDRMQELYNYAVELSRKKNADYAGVSNNPWGNLIACEQYGIPPKQGILVRMSDKMTRISTLLKQDAQVKDESILDTLSDLANYSIILRMLIEQESETIASVSSVSSVTKYAKDL